MYQIEHYLTNTGTDLFQRWLDSLRDRGARARILVRINRLAAGSFGDCKPLAESFDFESLRRRVLIPTGVEDASLRTEGPYAYRDLDECLGLIEEYVEEISRFAVVGYMGHL